MTRPLVLRSGWKSRLVAPSPGLFGIAIGFNLAARNPEAARWWVGGGLLVCALGVYAVLSYRLELDASVLTVLRPFRTRLEVPYRDLRTVHFERAESDDPDSFVMHLGIEGRPDVVKFDVGDIDRSLLSDLVRTLVERADEITLDQVGETLRRRR